MRLAAYFNDLIVIEGSTPLSNLNDASELIEWFFSLFFTEITIQYYFITILVVILTSILFSLAGLLNAIFADSFDDITIIPTFVLTPLIYLGGVFYSITLLTETWQLISKLNPLL